MYGSNSSVLSRKDIKRFSTQRTTFVVVRGLSLALALVLTVVLVWLRLDWGITDWVHQVTGWSVVQPYYRCRLTSHSSGAVSTSCSLVVVSISGQTGPCTSSGCCFSLVSSLLACCAAANGSPRLLVLVGLLLIMLMLFHLFVPVFLLFLFLFLFLLILPRTVHWSPPAFSSSSWVPPVCSQMPWVNR